jgi:hypothetical protein
MLFQVNIGRLCSDNCTLAQLDLLFQADALMNCAPTSYLAQLDLSVQADMTCAQIAAP